MAPESDEGDARRPGRGQRLDAASPASPTESVTHLVLGYDLAPASQRALEVAVDLAARLSAELHVVHVVDLADYPIDPESADWEERAQAALRREQEQVEQALAGQSGAWTYHAWRGDPVTLLAAVAEEEDALMIIVGTRGGGFSAALARLVGGSTSQGLIRRRQRPVLVVPRPPEPRTPASAASPNPFSFDGRPTSRSP